MSVPEDDEMRVAKHRPSKFPEVEEELVNWLIQMKQQNALLTDNLIRTKAKETARNLQIPDERFKASSGWVENFKHRHNIRKGVWLGPSKNGRTGRGAVHDLRNGNEGVLSPLNPAFEPRSEFLDDRESIAPSNTADDIDDDMESEDSPDPEPNQRDEVESRPSLSLQPSWRVEPDTSSIANTSLSPDRSSAQHQSVSQQPYVPVHHHHHNHHHHHHNGAEPEGPQNPPPSHEGPSIQYPDAVVVYQTAPPITAGSAIPDIAEAEDAINKVIMFVDSQANLLTSSEREALTQIKYALFQAASGVPYTRERR
ncbi:CenpB-DNA-bind-domain-containing protein [Leucogyrophana mollusca]|uniref:CenpB-DNA-bind-domain-containing protein n=1 Tax=Leucogyrophana mollusca TaxID=85980 RepID=A0ACB8B8V9_9AGAM|nr:CenpB-DNA-bind-domain-containing protein [Leucogyrophana mollusca]